MPEPNEQGISEQQEQIDEEVFSDGDYLKLLQLEARQSIKQRRASKDNFRLTSSGVPNSFPSQDEIIPKLWRLVPEGVTPYQWQEECLQKWMDANCRGTVKVATGGGKTLFALLAAQTLQNQKRPDLRVAIVVPTIPLMNQWRDEMSKGNLPSSAFALMGGGNQVEDLSVYRIVIAVLNSAREKLPELVQKAEWSSRMLLVVDECHRAEAEQARRIFDSKPAYTLGLSATPEPGLEYEDVPPDDSYNQSVIGQNIGPIIYEFSLQDSLNAGLLTPFEVWHIGFPLTHEEQVRHDDLSRKISDLKKGLEARYRKSRSKQGFIAWCQTVAKRNTPEAEDAQQFIGLANQRKRLLYRARARQDLTLAILSEACTDRDVRAIVFHEVIDETERLFLEAERRHLPVVLEHSELPSPLRNKNIEAFRKGTARIIISARSLIEGFNVPSADVGIIVASSSSVRQRIQSLGRLLRRKEGDRHARVYVLYARNTEDEAIYEKADWEDILGVQQNRYFYWDFGKPSEDWKEKLQEVGDPPRTYRPPCSEVDINCLQVGDPYPGQTKGEEVRVDQQGNWRYCSDDTMVPASAEAVKDVIEKVLHYNNHRWAVITPCGHVITRTDDNQWVFLGQLPANESRDEKKEISSSSIKLKIKHISGRRRIVKDQGRELLCPIGPEGMEEQLLDWVKNIEHHRGLPVYKLCWNGESLYWVEIQGERIFYDDPNIPPKPLEFPNHKKLL